MRIRAVVFAAAASLGTILVGATILAQGKRERTERSEPTPKPKLRVVSYNVLRGFRDYRIGKPYHPGAKRKTEITTWLAAKQPDVVALQELNGYKPPQLRRDAAKWGHPHSVLLKKWGFSTGLTSTRPIQVVARKMKGLHHGLMVCRTFGVDFVVVHLWPFKGDDARMREVRVVGEFVAASRKTGREVVVIGDLNAVSPHDLPLLGREARQRITKWRWEKDEKGKPRTHVLRFLFELGLQDVHAKHLGKGPLPMPRIDFILATKKLAGTCRGAAWFTDPAMLRNSDHPPVLADFDWNAEAKPGR